VRTGHCFCAIREQRPCDAACIGRATIDVSRSRRFCPGNRVPFAFLSLY
jgi:hypothetical protein